MPTAQEMLDKYLVAEQAVLEGQRVRFNDGATEQWLDMSDLEFIQRGRREWEAKASAAAARAAKAATIGGLGYSVARMDGS